MDGDFQHQYLDTERAYGLGDYAESHRLASGLLEQLVSQPQETLAELAQQGLESSLQSRSATSQPEPRPDLKPSPDEASAGELSQATTAQQPLPDMLRDPFLKDQPAASGSSTSFQPP